MDQSVNIALALGSNLGNRRDNISRAISMLESIGVKDIVSSSFKDYPPVDCPEGSGEFLNGALIGKWNRTAEELLKKCNEVEREMGRPQQREINSPRTIDIDILLFGNECICVEGLSVPHKRMLNRNFVMMPLAEIAGDWIVPGTSKSVGELAGELI